ncbi:NRDE family protein [Marinobacter bohaiensis]|uniref:NRDE family protein n=1 Tax=Marinobacter bohaiensis TaxID=2201898 RepID=UPI003898DEC0
MDHLPDSEWPLTQSFSSETTGNTMCLILFAIDQHPDLPLVVAANRDEFYERPTEAMHWWSAPEILAGRDSRSGGTWLAITRDGSVAAVTNVRDGRPEAGERSRGNLPIAALERNTGDLKRELDASHAQFAGYNLVRANGQRGWYYSNRDSHPGRTLFRGAYGLSNHLLQSPWPKLVRLRHSLVKHMRETPVADLHDALIEALMDTTPAPDAFLPDTGVGLERERFLSAPFIRSEHYGTRATTIVSVHRNGEIQVTEQNWRARGETGPRQTFRWIRPS